VGPFEGPFSYLPVYKLVRFYEPDSEAQYVTTRATLTLFSELFFLFFFLCQYVDMTSLESDRLHAFTADNVWFRRKMFHRLWKGLV
jgi:hypothetical protein